MSQIELLLIAIGLALDATAVSISNGLQMSCFLWRPALRMACAFSLFQMIMPLAGWLLGRAFSKMVASFDHWLAFLLLTAIGMKMILEKHERECVMDDPENRGKPDIRGTPPLATLLLLAVATSIDAFAVGITFSLLRMHLLLPILLIGLVTFLLSFFGVLAGQKCAPLLRWRVEILGGTILIMIGLKILVEHLFFS